MTMTKLRSGERGFWRCPVSVTVAARPDEIMAFTVLALDQAGVDRGGKARIVQLDGEIFALRLAGDLPPGRTELGVLRCTAKRRLC